jgi:hypothetical protein
MPLKVPASFASIKKQLRHSATKRKRSGDKGKPCITPCSTVKKEEATPLINIEKDIEVKQAIVQFVKATPKSKCISNIRIYSQFTLSKAFERSILMIAPLSFLLFKLWSPS